MTTPADLSTEHDEEQAPLFENGENEILFDLDELTDQQLRLFEGRVRTLLRQFGAYSIIVNSNDLD